MPLTKKKPTEGEEKTSKKSKLLSVTKLKKKTEEKSPKTPTKAASAATKAKDEAATTPVKKPEAKKSAVKKLTKKTAETPERSSLSMPGVKTPSATTPTPTKKTKTTKSTDSPLKTTARAKSETTKGKSLTPEVSKGSKATLERKSKDVSKTAVKSAAKTPSKTPTPTPTPKSTTPTPTKTTKSPLTKEKKKKTGAETPKDKVIGMIKKIGSFGGKTPREKKEKTKKGTKTTTKESSVGLSPEPKKRLKSASEKSSKASPGAKSASRKGESNTSTLSPAPEISEEISKEESVEPVTVEPEVEVEETVEEKKVEEVGEAGDEMPEDEIKEIEEKPKEVEEEPKVEEAVEKPKEDVDVTVEKPEEKPEETAVEMEAEKEEAEEKLLDVSPTGAAEKPPEDDEEPPEAAVPVTPAAETVLQPTEKTTVTDRSLPSASNPTLIVPDLETAPEGLKGDEAMDNLVSPLPSTIVEDVVVGREDVTSAIVIRAPPSTASSASVEMGSEDLSVGGSLASTVQMHESGEDEMENYLDVPEQKFERTEIKPVGPGSISSLSSVGDLDDVPEDMSKPDENISEEEETREYKRDAIPGAKELLPGEDDSYESSIGAELDTVNDSQSLGDFDIDMDADLDDYPTDIPEETPPKETETVAQPPPQPDIPTEAPPKRQPQVVKAILPSREPIERPQEDSSGRYEESLSSLSSIDPDDFIMDEPSEERIEHEEEAPQKLAPPVGLPLLGRSSGGETKTNEGPSSSMPAVEQQPKIEEDKPTPVATEIVQEAPKAPMPPPPVTVPVAPVVTHQTRDLPLELVQTKSEPMPPAVEVEKTSRDIPPEPSPPVVKESKPESSVRPPTKKVGGPKGLPMLGLGLRPRKKSDVSSPMKAETPKASVAMPDKIETPPPREAHIWDKPKDIPEETPKTDVTAEAVAENVSLAIVSGDDHVAHLSDLDDFGVESDFHEDNKTDGGRSPLLSPAPTEGYHSNGFSSGLSEEEFTELSNADEVIPDIGEPFVEDNKQPKVEDVAEKFPVEKDIKQPDVEVVSKDLPVEDVIKEASADDKDEFVPPIRHAVSIDEVIVPARSTAETELPQSQVLDEDIEEDRSKGRRGNTLISCAVYVLGGISGIAVTVLFFSSRGG